MCKDVDAGEETQAVEELVPSSRQVDEIEEKLKEMCGILLDLREQFSTRIDHDQAKNLLVSRMVERVEALEDDFLFREFRKRLFLDLIMLYDRVTRLSTDRATTEVEVSDFDSIAGDLLQMLKSQGVVRVVAPSAAFDASIQEALDVVDTPDKSMDNTVSEILRDGFVYRDVLLRPQGVMVARFAEEESSDE